MCGREPGPRARAGCCRQPGGSARSGHQRPDVRGGDADAPLLGGGQHVAERAAEVKCVPHGHGTDAEPLRFVHREPHGLVAGELAERVAAVECGDRAMVGHDLGCLLEADRARAESLHVHRDEHRAV